MNRILRQFRPESSLHQEQRLCALDNPLRGAGEWLGEKYNQLSANTKACFDYLRTKSANIANDVFNVWRLDPRPEEQKNGQLMTIAEFARTAPPSLQSYIEQGFRDGERPTLAEVTSIYSQQAWIELFNNPNNFFVLSLPQTDRPTLRQGPKGILQAMDEEHRKLFYYEYVEGIIPLAVRDNPRYREIFGGSGDKLARAGEMVKHLSEINGAMGMMLGINAPPDEATRDDDAAFNIAREGLMNYYWRDGKRYIPSADGVSELRLPLALGPVADTDEYGQRIDRGEGLKPQFMQDVARVVGNDIFMGRAEDIRDRIGPSFLKGALDPAFGVMEPDDLPELRSFIGNRSADKTANDLQTRVDTRRNMDVIRREQRRNAETLGQTFSNMSGMEKIALVSLAAYMISTSKGVRNAIGALGVLYFGQKFLLKQKDPINEVWSPLIQGLAKKSADFVRPGFQKFGIEFDHEQYSDQEIQRRINLMSRFLSENSRMEFNTSVQGFTILADMKLSELSQFFTISSTGTLASVRFWDPAFKKMIRERCAKHGLDPATAEKFFGGLDPEEITDPMMRKEFEDQRLNRHMREAGDGLGTVFYMCAVREPENKVPMRIIEYFRSTMGFGSYQDLPIGQHYAEYIDERGAKRRELVYPRQLYVELVRRGQELANGKDISLLNFVQQELGADTNPVNAPPKPPIAPAPAPAPAGPPPVIPPTEPMPPADPGALPPTPAMPPADPGALPPTAAMPPADPGALPPTGPVLPTDPGALPPDRKSTRLNSSHTS